MSTGTNANTIGPDLDLVNEGATAVDLSTVKIHYYFTADGDTSLAFNCDYSGYVNTNLTGLSSANVSGTFVSMGANATPYADTYLEIAFTTATLPASGTAAVNFRIHDSSFATNYDQANDWSFFSNVSGATGYVDAQYITAYVNGTLAWGIEPGPIAPDAGGSRPDGGNARPDATVGDANTGDATAPDAAHSADGGGG
jgi:hypothetical protein